MLHRTKPQKFICIAEKRGLMDLLEIMPTGR
jgi:hypothetical protein